MSFLRGTLLVLERSEDGGWSFGYVDGRADKGFFPNENDFGTSAERSALSDNVCALMSEDR